MPAPDPENTGKNIEHYMAKGRPRKQAIAIALSRKRAGKQKMGKNVRQGPVLGSLGSSSVVKGKGLRNITTRPRPNAAMRKSVYEQDEEKTSASENRKKAAKSLMNSRRKVQKASY